MKVVVDANVFVSAVPQGKLINVSVGIVNLINPNLLPFILACSSSEICLTGSPYKPEVAHMGVFVLSDSQGLVALTPSEFVNEDDFQRLLEKHPALLSGNQADVETTRRWLLIKREKSIPAEDGGSGRWSVDHLFVDQDGIPTLVEVKRQSDTRLRREVVGQMLDYAANAVVYWPVEQLRAEFEQGYAASGTNPDEEIRERLALDGDAELLWQSVKTNLQAGRIRMLFVADRIPAELRRIVEFMNKQMDPAEVLALELRQFQGEGVKTIVPTLYGQTEEAQQKKAVPAPRLWDEASILADIESRHGSAVLRTAQKILEWIKANTDELWYGQGSKDGSIALIVAANGLKSRPLFLWTYGTVEVAFPYMKKPFDNPAKREELRDRLAEIDGVSLPEGAIDKKRPGIPVLTFSNEETLKHFFDVMDWCIRELRSA
jgi:hypothetical protein